MVFFETSKFDASLYPWDSGVAPSSDICKIRFASFRAALDALGEFKIRISAASVNLRLPVEDDCGTYEIGCKCYGSVLAPILHL